MPEAATTPPTGSTEQTPDHWFDRAPRAAVLVFGAVVVAAVPFYLVTGRHQWFFQDDWVFLAARDGGSLHDLMAPHNEHWSTVPVVLYRLLFNVVGMRSYVPYQLLAIATHLAITVLLYVVMRRSVRSPWIAVTGATTFALLGEGSRNIVWGFQVGFAGGLAWGLAQMLLADHDGPVDWRDVAALLCGLLALASSGTGATAVFVVGLAVLLRRGWRRAAVQVVPLGAAYLAWIAIYGRHGLGSGESDASDVIRFVWFGIRHVGVTLGGYAPVAVVLAAIVVAGFVLVGQKGIDELRTRAGLPAAMLIGALVFFFLTGAGRAGHFGAEWARLSRYTHVGAALVVPSLALGVDQLSRRLPRLSPVLVALLLVGVPANLRSIETRSDEDVPREVVVALATSDEFDTVPDDYAPFPSETGAREITMGWLRQAHRHHGLQGRPDAGAVDEARKLLTVYIDQDRRVPRHCTRLRGPEELMLRAGEAVGFDGVLLVAVTPPDGEPFLVPRSSPRPVALVAGRGPLRIRVSPFRGKPARLCR